MASIARDKNGTRRILFVAANGKRPTIRLGKASQRAAEAVKFRVEQLLAAKMTGHALEADTVRWLSKLDSSLAKKLAKVGLIPEREAKPTTTLGAFLDAYLAGRTDVKPGTMINLDRTRRELLAFFGETKPIAEINEGDADDFRLSLKKRLGENTVRRMCGRARQFFRAAIKRRLIAADANPFGEMKGIAVQANKERFYFVSREEAAKVLDACPDSQWRLLFALSRYGGLRCPSEHLALTWADIDWELGRMQVRSSKTEHHEGKGRRVVPIFPELRPYLEEAWDAAEPGTEYVITRYRDANSNLRTQLERIIKRAGLETWPKLFQNLRSTRETELAETFPLHVVCDWIGNSQAVAAKHYLQVTDDHFSDATKPVPKIAQNAAQQAHALARNEPQALKPADEQTYVLLGNAIDCDFDAIP
ncbi:MAG: tyrosine-type recombinase/integrase [Planctomycetota bacterium]|nr:tyrosine-type recombinase/integrase [Planctomycetota bacterium]